MQVPDSLIDAILRGNCVAFLGAGFSAPVAPGWAELLQKLAEQTHGRTRELVTALIANGSSRDLEAAAQMIRDDLGIDGFSDALTEHLHPVIDGRMTNRLDHLNGIPFRAVLTTNFDGILPGHGPGREAYIDVLRRPDALWWDDRNWSRSGASRTAVNLHGSIDDPSDVVFTRRDYRRRLHSDPGYTTFLRAVMATTTMLYLGVSFTDAYLDELRSEILSLIDFQPGDEPIAYAFVADATQDEIEYARRHEGIEIVHFDSANGFEAFDQLLADIHRRTHPLGRLKSHVAGKRVLWLDPRPENNGYGTTFLREAAAGGGERSLVEVANVEDAVASLVEIGADLVISHWGHGKGSGAMSNAEQLLTEMRQRDLRAPVIVFASGERAEENRPAALALGASDYVSSWDALFREIERILMPPQGQRS